MLLQTTALETAANAILITHIDGTIVWVNAAFTTTTGYTAEEAIGRTPRILKSGTHDQSTYQDLWETITSGRTWRGEFVNRRKNGSVYYDESTVTPVRASNGAITHFVSVMQDITERKQAEADLRASETWLRAIFEASRDGVLVEDDGVVVYASRSYKEMLGYDDAEDMVGWPVSRLLPPGEAERLTSYGVARLRGEPVPTVYEFLVRCKDGSVTDVEGAVSTFSIGGKQYVTTNIRNITDSKKALALAREQASLIDQAHDAIIVRDLAGRITFWNKGAERLFGFPAGDAMGSRFDELLKIDAGSFETATRTTIASGVWSGQVERTTATGQTVAVDASWTLMLDDHGQPKAIFSIDTNITDRKNLEKQFLRAQRLESLGTLAGGIAHDLNNLLMPIMMGVTLLKRLDPSARGLLAINNIERSVKRGTDLVKQVMLFARGVEGARTVIDLREIVSEVEAIAESTFPKNITFVTNMPARLSKVMGDATQLNQVLLNLCVNARDAMPSGGHITIDAEERTVDQQQAVLLGGVAGSYVVLEVADTGSGIPHEVLERIFEPFFTTKDIGKGTGLGLSTVQGIVRSHGGFIEVVSEAGIGSRFRVYLPPDAEAALPIVPELPIESLPRGHGEVILLVDDEVAILGITRQTLEEFGYTVLTAEDGAQAIGVYARDFRNIAVVITDMMMPVIDGAGLIAALRGINPNVIVIASSGHTDGNEMARATAAGATQFLWKPFGAEVMLQTLEQVLPHPGGTAIDPTPPLPVIAAA